jgi:hypothetical protein
MVVLQQPPEPLARLDDALPPRAYSADMTERDAAGAWSSASLPIGGRGGTGEGNDGVDVSLIRWFLGLSPGEHASSRTPSTPSPGSESGVQPTDFEAILRVLAGHKVDLVVVGGVAATLQGAPVTTFDLDIVHSREEANLDRLMAALRGLDAWYREKPDLRIAPDRERLGGPGHHLLMTRASRRPEGRRPPSS